MTAGSDDVTAKVKAVVKSLAGDEEPDAVPDKEPKSDQAEDTAARARTSYDAMLKWVLGVFSAVGLLIFGSVPFADLDGVSWQELLRSLGPAGLGLIIVLLASTTAMELQDASLGELAKTFEERKNAQAAGGVHRLANSRLFPRNHASNALRTIMEDSNDGPAHLGPGIESVSQLINRLKELEELSFKVYFDWDGGDVGGPAKPLELTHAGGVQESPAVDVAWVKAAADQMKALQEAMKALAAHRKDRDKDADDAHVRDALLALEAQYSTMISQVAERDPLTKAARIATVDELLNVYRQYRSMVLGESVVAQMRGTFRVVRRWLLVGGVLVLAGGVMLTHAIANSEDRDPKAAVTVTLAAEKGPWKKLKDCSGVEKADLEIAAILLNSDDGDGAQNGPFEAVVATGPCAGHTVEVDEGEGSYVRRAS